MEKLREQLNYQLALCDRAYNQSTRKTFYDQAFGMAGMYMCLHPEEGEAVTMLWNDEYRPKFESMIYGN